MTLQLIRIKNLRNIAEAELEPSAGINFIVGNNGAGKTSLLEGIYVLGKGRSFRGSHLSSIIMKSSVRMEIYGEIRPSTKIGIIKETNGTQVRVNSRQVYKQSILARHFPVFIINPISHEILDRSSAYRRKLIDWGVFHVEHSYRNDSAQYMRLLNQRNAALKTGKRDLVDSWAEQFARYGEKIEESRNQYVVDLKKETVSILGDLNSKIHIDIVWKRGWPDTERLHDSLVRTMENDLNRGFTYYGPHRSDLVVTQDGESVKHWSSRGQQKLLITALVLAQARMIKNEVKAMPCILFDDPYAELDSDSRENIIANLVHANAQCFLTSTNLSRSDERLGKVFHVEHGVVHTKGV